MTSLFWHYFNFSLRKWCASYHRSYWWIWYTKLIMMQFFDTNMLWKMQIIVTADTESKQTGQQWKNKIITLWGCVSSAYPILLWWLWEYVLYLIIIIKSEVWIINQYLGLGHETMVWAVCLIMFLCNTIILVSTLYFDKFSYLDQNMRNKLPMVVHLLTHGICIRNVCQGIM